MKENKKSKLLGVFVTEEEYVSVKKQALELDMSLSSLMRLRLGLEPPKKRRTRCKDDVISEGDEE